MDIIFLTGHWLETNKKKIFLNKFFIMIFLIFRSELSRSQIIILNINKRFKISALIKKKHSKIFLHFLVTKKSQNHDHKWQQTN